MLATSRAVDHLAGKGEVSNPSRRERPEFTHLKDESSGEGDDMRGVEGPLLDETVLGELDGIEEREVEGGEKVQDV